MLEVVGHSNVGRVTPATFAGCLGMLHEGERTTGVLLCGPWGFEDLSNRKSWRHLAEMLAASGFPALRFDWPGTGNSLDPGSASSGLSLYLDAIGAAAAEFRRWSDIRRIVLVGQGLGATLAWLAAREPGLSREAALLAPVAKGRRYLRHIGAWEQMIAGSMGYPAETARADGAVAIAGFAMPRELAAEVGRIDLQMGEPPRFSRVLVAGAGRDDPSAKLLASRAAEAGAKVVATLFDGYDELVSGPMSAVTPWPLYEQVRAWVEAGEEAGESATPATRRACGSAPMPLIGDGFREKPVSFGPGGGLVGVLCQPPASASGAALLVNTGSDHHTGWGRSTVEQARLLARHGVASLRFDAAGIGDSPARPETPAQVIYSDAQLPDALDALSCLEAAGYRHVVVVGRCSGAYLALNLALADPRVAGLVLVNLRRFVWNPADRIDDVIRHIPRSLDDYRHRLRARALWGRLRRGEVNVVSGLRNFSLQLATRLAPRLVRGKAWRHLHDEAHRRLAALRDRAIPVSFVFSEDDLALDEYAAFLGAGGEKLRRYPNMQAATIAGADHNFTPDAAKHELLEMVCRDVAAALPPARQTAAA